MFASSSSSSSSLSSSVLASASVRGTTTARRRPKTSALERIIVFQKQYSNTNDYEISKKGSYVEIIDFNSLSNGLLGITVKSINKVTIKNLTQLEDGLHIANTHPLIDPEVDDQALLAEFPEITNILNQLIKHPRILEMPLDVDFNSADSVAYHLAGLIPISWSRKQSLLEAFDASQRLTILSKYIEEISSN